jgi:katanin p80 WD40 repeat-containing subunit B1
VCGHPRVRVPRPHHPPDPSVPFPALSPPPSQEFAAHTSAVNCLKIGRKSSGVMVTGGEDKRVNLFSIGKPQAILSLAGHQSAVECVTFDQAEEVVVAGAAGGTLKLWDLEEAKVVRTLTGHRSNCSSVDFHPFGEFFASGSLDTNLKIWDIRRKGCIHTYKGHERGVSVCKFSPDGKWVLSGGQDGRVKLWDLTAGRLLRELPPHEGPVTSVEFHPNELLVATGSADRTVKFWDLETFEQIDEATESTGVRSMLFTPDGGTLLSGTSDFLKVWKWEPNRCCDAVDVSWTKLADLSMHEGKLLGASFQNSFVGVWVVDLNRVEPFHSGAERGPGGGGTREVNVERGRRDRDAVDPGSAAVAAAAEAARARALDARSTAAVNANGHAAGREPSPPRARDAAPFDPNKMARGDERERERERRAGTRTRDGMNADFAAAHGIGEDPLAKENHRVVYAKPPPPPATATVRIPPARVEPSSPPSSSSSSSVAEELDDDVSVSGSDAGSTDSLEAEDARRGHRDGSSPTAIAAATGSMDRLHLPPPRASSPVRASRRGRFSTNDGDLEALRSAALEADTQFVHLPGTNAGEGEGEGEGGDANGGEVETFEAAMARARAERARAENGGVGRAVGNQVAAGPSPIPGPTDDETTARLPGSGAATLETLQMTPPRLPSGTPPPRLPSGTPPPRLPSGTPPPRLPSGTPPPRLPSGTSPPRTPATPSSGATGLDFSSFLPGARSAPPASPRPLADESEVLARLNGPDRAVVADVFAARLATLRATRDRWIAGDVRGAAAALTRAGDDSAVVDVCRAALESRTATNPGGDALTLELAAALVPLAAPLLRSPHVAHADAALRFSRLAAGAFGDAMRGAASPAGRLGVDLAGEERAARAGAARRALLGERDALKEIVAEGGELAPRARELLGVLDAL